MGRKGNAPWGSFHLGSAIHQTLMKPYHLQGRQGPKNWRQKNGLELNRIKSPGRALQAWHPQLKGCRSQLGIPAYGPLMTLLRGQGPSGQS